MGPSALRGVGHGFVLTNETGAHLYGAARPLCLGESFLCKTSGLPCLPRRWLPRLPCPTVPFDLFVDMFGGTPLPPAMLNWVRQAWGPDGQFLSQGAQPSVRFQGGFRLLFRLQSPGDQWFSLSHQRSISFLGTPGRHGPAYPFPCLRTAVFLLWGGMGAVDWSLSLRSGTPLISSCKGRLCW